MSAEEILREYDQLVRTLRDKAPSIDPLLLIRSSILSRKYPTEEKQSFYLELHLEKGVDADRKRSELFHRVGTYAANHGNNHLQMTVVTSLDTILSLAGDREIERIEGEVYPFA
ncbi:MAG: hypothetical protein ABI361_03815 [Nitrososphaera sp.]|jgi:thymidine phosphorylase